jgi:hypothetical protein
MGAVRSNSGGITTYFPVYLFFIQDNRNRPAGQALECAQSRSQRVDGAPAALLRCWPRQPDCLRLPAPEEAPVEFQAVIILMLITFIVGIFMGAALVRPRS